MSMVPVNQKVADEIVTLVARHRHAAEGRKDAIKAAEDASKERNDELARRSAEKRAEITELAESMTTPSEPEKPTWAARERDSYEIDLATDDDEVEEQPVSRQPVPAQPVAPAQPKAPARRPVFDDDDDDFENQSWLR
ncbi:hypothetical protein GIY23_19975 [Allosaccharopolyspora coralli]|uniref:Uncharacterized protein n=1 Tax=Allosaccharopolyspora coralli TaxID=2665642 RepID=A0A5Q3QE35_9PSEU|nr:hypothetical protein [Allosaccharopolyspora coralli]QGK71484.1 hypothetical protein GIY23_19975 [Allosaccharopolyspora coralli]